MRKFTLLFLVMFVTLLINSAFVSVPESLSTVPEAAASTNVAVTKKASKGKLFMKILKNKFEKVAQKAKRAGDKSKVVAAVLAFFLGGFGAHDFYLGNKRNGFIKLGLTLIGMALYIAGLVAFSASEAVALPILAIIGYLIILGVGIWAFVDFIRILTGSYEPVDGSYRD